ncbi:TPA: 5,10-methylenetetrahydrofolate reductase [bacterium]|nr:5,10-methylenetetrahydrofolate reductase [bacterium]
MKAGSNLEKILKSREFAVTAELGPPKNADRDVIEKKVKILKGFADAVNVTDNQTAIVRMSSMAACSILVQLGLEPIMQMVTRDRNRIAIQSDILGASALGIKNLLCLTGDHQKSGNHPQSKNVYDLDSVQLVAAVKKMRDDKRFINGEEIKEHEPRIFIGAAESPFADPTEIRTLRLAKKIRAGADFIQTQAIYDLDRFEEWMKEVREKGLDKEVHILVGLIPLKSFGMAKYMNTHVAGVNVPEDLMKRIKEAEDPKREGIKICVEAIDRLKRIEGVHGVHIMAIEWEDAVPTIVEEANLLPRPKI